MKETEKEMYYGTSPQIFENARILRKNMTEAEKVLWNKLKNRQLSGVKFRRQHPVNRFIVDFYTHEVKLAIEIDGIIHKFKKEYDEGRTAELEKFGIKVIRFDNDEIMNNLDEVLDSISNEITLRLMLCRDKSK